MATSNGQSRRRNRTRDDGPLELQEPARFLDRTRKKDSDRDRERSKRSRLSRSKRRKRENCMHREDGADDSSDQESFNDDDDEDVPASSSPIPSPAPTSRNSYPPSSNVSKLQPTWRDPSEKIPFTIPRKARTACTKRAHGSWSSLGAAEKQILRRASSSPLQSPVSPSSSSSSMKMKIANGANQRPQKSPSKSAFTVEDQIEIEVAEVLYGLQNSSSSTPPLSAVAPKRKRPRPVSNLEKIRAGFAWRSNPNSTAAMSERNPPAKEEVHPSNLGKKSDSAVDNGGLSSDFKKSDGPHSTPEATRSESASGVLSSDDNSPAADLSLGKEAIVLGKGEEVLSSKKESADDRAQSSAILELATATTTTSDSSEKESRGKENIEIDHTAPPPQSRSSPEREREMDHNFVTDRDAEPKSNPTEGDEEKADKPPPADSNAVVEDKGTQSSTESGAQVSKLNQEPPLLNHWRNDTSTDRTAQPSSLPSSMSVPPRWPPRLPPMGFAPLQGLVPMEGRPMAPTAIQPPQFLFTQPRPSRCATHRYIAKNISSHQQFLKNYPVWHAPIRPVPLINLVPAAGNASERGNPNNIMHGPTALFFPLGQQQQVTAAGAAASACPSSSVRSQMPAGTAPSTSMSTSAPNASASSGRPSSTPMSFNYPNMPANETQYLNMLLNGAYQFPIPAHVGAIQAYRGARPQVMPFFNNGSHRPSQMPHPSQLQQQQQAPRGAQPMQIQQNQQNPSASIASSSSSQRHTLNQQQQRPQGSSANGATTSPGLQNFPAPKPRAPQTQQQQQHQAFPMPFVSMNGVPANLDIQSMVKNHAFLQSLPEAVRNNFLRMVAAQTAHQRRNHQGFDDGKSGAPDSSNPDIKRKGIDVAESSVSRNNVLDSSARSLNLAPGFAHTTRTPTASSSDRDLQKLLRDFGPNARQPRVAPSTSNGSIPSDQLAATKFPPNSYPGNAPSVAQGSSTQTHARQWQNSGRTIATQASTPSMPTSIRNMGQQDGITQHGHAQISFGRNPKAAAPSQGQQQGQNAAAIPQSLPPPMRVGSPSVPRGYSGSPMMNSSSIMAMGNMLIQAPSLPDQPVMNSVSGRNGPCVLEKSQMPASSSMGSSKPQLQQQLSQ